MNDMHGGNVFLMLQQERGRYRDTSGDVGVVELLDRSELRDTLASMCLQDIRDVEVRGRLYSTLVHVLRTSPNVAYIEADQDGVPVEAVQVKSKWSQRWVREYARQLSRRWKHSDALTPDTELRLDSCFVPPRFSLLSSEQTDPQDDGAEVTWERLADHSRIVLLGEPGAGKTSCMRRLLQDADTHSARRTDTVPIYIQLRNFPIDALTTSGLRRVLATEKSMELEAELDETGSAGRVLLLLDGLDELRNRQDKKRATENIRQLCGDLRNIRIVLTSRASSYNWELPDFTHLRLLPFNSAQQAQWTRQYVVQLKGGSAWESLRSDLYQDEQLSGLLCNPLLLATVVSLCVNSSIELNDRVSLFRKCLDVLLQDWDSARGVSRWTSDHVTPRQISITLSELSAELLRSNNSEFTIDDVHRLTADHIGLPSRPDLLLSACREMGLVSFSGDQRYRFSHATFQEYLAARHLVNKWDTLRDYLVEHVSESRAHRVWALSCSITTDADDLLTAALQMDMPRPDRKALLLARILGYEVSAARAIIKQCCRVHSRVEL